MREYKNTIFQCLLRGEQSTESGYQSRGVKCGAICRRSVAISARKNCASYLERRGGAHYLSYYCFGDFAEGFSSAFIEERLATGVAM